MLSATWINLFPSRPGRTANTTFEIFLTPLSLNKARLELMFLMTHPTGLRTKIPVFSRPPQPITNHSHFCTEVMFLMVLTTSCVGRLSKVTLVSLDSRRDKIRLSTDSSLGLIRLTSSKKAYFVSSRI